MKIITKKDIVNKITKNMIPKGTECKVQEVRRRQYMVYYNEKSWIVEKCDVIAKGDENNAR
jgi:hypothetical protein